MSSYPTSDGRKLLLALIETVDKNGAYLSEIDGATGDGDHGINMTKGVRRTKEKLGEQNVTVPQGLDMLGQVLLAEIGGAMGPLYGSFFIDMGTAAGDAPAIDKEVFGKMLKAGAAAMQDLGGAKVGDKTMMDALVPAVLEYEKALAEGVGFSEALQRMADAAEKGKEATRDMIAKLGRASRLGERSRGILDAGSVSCSLILKTFADTLRSTGQK
ncbi:MAG TPA: dihydroxyacetone kinase subunit DhaL [Terrimicrobiaceae bacterium]